MSWALWRKGLKLAFLQDNGQLLRIPLGAWKPAKEYHHCWRWNHTPDGLHQQTQRTTNIKKYIYHSTVRRNLLFMPCSTQVTDLPCDSIPVEPLKSAQHYQVNYNQIFPYPHQPTKCAPERIWDMIRQLPPSLRNLVQHVQSLATEQEIETCLQANQTIRIASDGGAIPGRASYGWILQIGAIQIAKGKGPTHGGDPRSFRAEGYGMAAALLYLRLLQRLHKFQHYNHTTIVLICNNQGLLQRISQAVEWTYTTPNVTL
jgi:hypothetical protein